ncbi:uncharacterized protein METZ01_LOCUS515888, partial [marine metagenome]
LSGGFPSGVGRRTAGMGSGHHGSGRTQPRDDCLVRVGAPRQAKIQPARSGGDPDL